jgi:hypothetical protein
MVDAQKLNREISEQLFLLELSDDGIDFKGRFDEVRVVVGPDCFVFVCHFVVAAKEGPLAIRSNIDAKAQIL